MLIITITDSDKSVDEEEYMFFRMNREKMAGENLREGIVEVASEQWIEQGGCAGFIHRIKSPQVGSNVIPTLQGSSIG